MTGSEYRKSEKAFIEKAFIEVYRKSIYRSLSKKRKEVFRTQNLSYPDQMFIVFYREVYAHECRSAKERLKGVYLLTK